MDISQPTKGFLETLKSKYMTFWKAKCVTDKTRIYEFVKYKGKKENWIFIWIVEGQFKLFEVWI